VVPRWIIAALLSVIGTAQICLIAHIQTSTVRKPLAANTFQCAFKKVDHVVRLLLSGEGSTPLRFSTLAIVPRPTL